MMVRSIVWAFSGRPQHVLHHWTTRLRRAELLEIRFDLRTTPIPGPKFPVRKSQGCSLAGQVPTPRLNEGIPTTGLYTSGNPVRPDSNEKRPAHAV